MVMELADQSLFNKLQKTRRFGEKQVFEQLKDIIKALNYLHTRKPKIIHRDLKPENILEIKRQLKIADFGWSNKVNGIRTTFCGTPEYLAPEMIRGQHHDEKLDMWTLGVLMYELLHGVSPFSLKPD